MGWESAPNLERRAASRYDSPRARRPSSRGARAHEVSRSESKVGAARRSEERPVRAVRPEVRRPDSSGERTRPRGRRPARGTNRPAASRRAPAHPGSARAPTTSPRARPSRTLTQVLAYRVVRLPDAAKGAATSAGPVDRALGATGALSPPTDRVVAGAFASTAGARRSEGRAPGRRRVATTTIAPITIVPASSADGQSRPRARIHALQRAGRERVSAAGTSGGDAQRLVPALRALDVRHGAAISHGGRSSSTTVVVSAGGRQPLQPREPAYSG